MEIILKKSQMSEPDEQTKKKARPGNEVKYEVKYDRDSLFSVKNNFKLFIRAKTTLEGLKLFATFKPLEKSYMAYVLLFSQLLINISWNNESWVKDARADFKNTEEHYINNIESGELQYIKDVQILFEKYKDRMIAYFDVFQKDLIADFQGIDPTVASLEDVSDIINIDNIVFEKNASRFSSIYGKLERLTTLKIFEPETKLMLEDKQPAAPTPGVETFKTPTVKEVEQGAQDQYQKRIDEITKEFKRERDEHVIYVTKLLAETGKNAKLAEKEARLEDRIRALETELNDEKKKKTPKKASSDELTRLQAELQKANDQIEEERNECANEIKQRDDRIQELEAIVVQLNQAGYKEHSDKLLFQGQKEELENTLRELGNNPTRRSDISGLSMEVIKLEHKIALLKAEQIGLDETIKRKETLNGELTKNKETLEKSIARKQHEVSNLASKKTTAELDAALNSSIKSQKEAVNAELIAHLANLKRQHDDLNTQIQEQKRLIMGLKSDEETLYKTKLEKKTAISKIENEIGILDTNIGYANATQMTRDGDLKRIQREIEQKEGALSELRTKINTITTDIKSETTRKENFQLQKTQLDAELKAIIKEIEDITKEKTDKAALQRQLGTAGGINSSLTEDLRGLNRRNAELERQITNATATVDAAEKRIANLKTRRDALETEEKTLNGDVESKQKIKDRIAARVEEVKAEIKRTIEERNTSQTDLNKLVGFAATLERIKKAKDKTSQGDGTCESEFAALQIRLKTAISNGRMFLNENYAILSNEGVLTALGGRQNPNVQLLLVTLDQFGYTITTLNDKEFPNLIYQTENQCVEMQILIDAHLSMLLHYAIKLSRIGDEAFTYLSSISEGEAKDAATTILSRINTFVQTMYSLYGVGSANTNFTKTSMTKSAKGILGYASKDSDEIYKIQLEGEKIRNSLLKLGNTSELAKVKLEADAQLLKQQTELSRMEAKFFAAKNEFELNKQQVENELKIQKIQVRNEENARKSASDLEKLLAENKLKSELTDLKNRNQRELNDLRQTIQKLEADKFKSESKEQTTKSLAEIKQISEVNDLNEKNRKEMARLSETIKQLQAEKLQAKADEEASKNAAEIAKSLAEVKLKTEISDLNEKNRTKINELNASIQKLEAEKLEGESKRKLAEEQKKNKELQNALAAMTTNFAHLQAFPKPSQSLLPPTTNQDIKLFLEGMAKLFMGYESKCTATIQSLLYTQLFDAFKVMYEDLKMRINLCSMQLHEKLQAIKRELKSIPKIVPEELGNEVCIKIGDDAKKKDYLNCWDGGYLIQKIRDGLMNFPRVYVVCCELHQKEMNEVSGYVIERSVMDAFYTDGVGFKKRWTFTIRNGV